MAVFGIDLHSDNFVVANKLGNKISKYYLASNGINKFLKTVSLKDYAVVEASTNTFSFYDKIKEHLKDVFVINPLKFKMICDSVKKTDKIDANKLSEVGIWHINNGFSVLPTINVPGKKIRLLRSLFTTYSLLKKEIVVIKNRIHSIFKENLYVIKAEIIFGKMRDNLDGLEIDASNIFQLKTLYRHLEQIHEEKEELKKQILFLGSTYLTEINILTSIKGISPFTAIAIISDMNDINLYKNAKAFSSYLRSTPKIDSSNKTVHIGKTSKQGRKLSITLILQSIRHFTDSNKNLADFKERKKDAKSKGKIRMAIARKMFVIIYFMLKEKKYYNYRDEEAHNNKMKIYLNFLSKNNIS